MLPKQQLHERFQKELSKLNEVQRQAVEQIEGPVLVIAGPGTGKTQILSARIGNILYTTDTQPHNILCLTYTDAGTVAMRKRLLQFIGPDAYRVHIFTFHAFCNQIIQDNLDVFGYRDLQPVSELESLQIFHKLIDSFDAENPLKRFYGDVYYDTRRLQELFQNMKKEAWSVDMILKAADEYLDSLPLREEFQYKKANAAKGIKAGDLNMRLFKKEKDDMEKLRAAIQGFPVVNSMMEKSRRYDYSDMILWVLEAFKSNPGLLNKYQEKYHYFLVDEYQDTNGAQNEILNLLTSYWDTPNVFVVGDDDQAIYRFQGANINNILDFYHQHKDHISIFLMQENYRSTQPILDAAGKLIVNNNERLVNKLQNLSKDLIASNQALKSLNAKPQIREYFNSLHEEASIAAELENLYKNGENLAEVAVIYRNHRLVDNLVKTLEKKAVPLNIKQKINILELPFIQNIIKLLEYIHEEYTSPDSAEALLYEVMHFQFFRISPRDIAIINRFCRGKEGKARKAWRSVICSRETLFQLNLEAPKPVSDLEENLKHWIESVPNVTVQALFEKILTRGGILSWIMKSEDKAWNLQVVTSFFDLIKEESGRTKYLNLGNLVDTLKLMSEHGIPIYLNKIIHNEQGVNFITAHSSKGLEYKKVYLMSSTADCWDKPSRRNSFKLPDTLITSSDEERSEDERRLFYVAITRAKEELIISYPAKKANEKEEEASRFVAEILSGSVADLIKISLPDNEILEYQSSLMLEKEAPALEFLDIEFLKDELKDYKMSVTHLNKFLRCPLSFYFENVMKVPSSRNENIGFGNAVHYALFNLFLAMQQNEQKQFPDEKQFMTFFKKGIDIYHSHFTKKEYDRRLEYGFTILPQYYHNYLNSWNKVTKMEYRISHCECEGVPLTGALDKVEFDGKAVNVVDYKTGNPENAKSKLAPPSDKAPLGGDYWRQIVFYRILLDNDKSTNYTMLSGEIDFIQPNNKKEFIKSKVFVKPEDIEIVKNQVKETYRRIMNLEFTNGCGEEDCSWCNFVKYNYNPAVVNLEALEE